MENLIWVIREVKIRANGNNRKRPSSLQKKNEKEKRIRKISKRAVHVTHLNGDEYVFPTLRNHTNLGTQAKRYIQPAGLVPWPDLFNIVKNKKTGM